MADPRIDFAGIGAQRCGTTWLFRCLLQHPSVRGPVAGAEKEVNFFNHHYTRGYHWYHSLFRFGPWKNGEFSVLYAPEASVPERIRRYRDDVRLIVSIRNPIERAFSQHLHEIRRGRVPRSLYDFSAALETNPSYITQGNYYTNLAPFYDLFLAEQLCVVNYDDISACPNSVLSRLFEFLGVDPTFQPPLADQVLNSARPARSQLTARALRGGADLLQRVGGDGLYIRAKRHPLAARFTRLNEGDFAPEQVPPMSEQTRRDLRSVFAPELASVGRLLGRDFSHWS